MKKLEKLKKELEDITQNNPLHIFKSKLGYYFGINRLSSVHYLTNAQLKEETSIDLVKAMLIIDIDICINLLTETKKKLES